MKKNMVPLLGIAFVVAVISTGVFYGLFAGRLHSKPADLAGQDIVVAARALERGTVLKAADLHVLQVRGRLAGSYSKVSDAVGETLLEPIEANEPLLQSRVASRDPKAPGAAGGIRSGMRAVSIRVAESSGLMGLIHEGSRVDVQAASERNGTPQLRTILQNMEVLRVSPQSETAGNGRPPIPVITLLVPAQSADLVALADTDARIRLALRNPLDEGTSPRHALALASLFEGGTGYAAQATPDDKANPGRVDHAVQLHVQVLGASSDAVRELTSRLTGLDDGERVRVATFRADTNAGDLVRKLEQAHELEVVSSSTLTASARRAATVRAAAASYQLRVQFFPAADRSGKLGLRVEPEISLRRSAGVETSRFDAAVPEDASFLVKGLLKGLINDESDAATLGGLFPGHSWAGRELIIFVTARADGSVAASAIAQSNRGQ